MSSVHRGTMGSERMYIHDKSGKIKMKHIEFERPEINAIRRDQLLRLERGTMLHAWNVTSLFDAPLFDTIMFLGQVEPNFNSNINMIYDIAGIDVLKEGLESLIIIEAVGSINPRRLVFCQEFHNKFNETRWFPVPIESNLRTSIMFSFVK